MALFRRKGSTVWWYEWVVEGAVRRGSTGETSKTAARAKAERIREELRAAASAGVRAMTLRALADAWLDEGRVTRRDWRNDESRVRKLFGQELREGRVVAGVRYGLDPNLAVHDLTAGHVADLMAARRREGNSPATMNREIALLQALLEFARKAHVRLPARAIAFRDYRQRESGGKLRYLSLDEERQLLDALAAKVRGYTDPLSPRARMAQDQFDLVVFLLDTGARYSEVAHLSWAQIDFEARTVNLFRSKVQNEGLLVMTDRLYALLCARRDDLAAQTQYVFPAWENDRRVCDRPRGWSAAGIQATMDALGFNAPSIVATRGRATPHSFRHTFASRMIAAGATLYEVQLLLGHAGPAMTQRYAHMDLGLGLRAAGRLNALHGAPVNYAGRVTTLSAPATTPGG